MAVDKTRSLKFENTSNGGTELDFYPTEVNPLEDYSSMKGVAFEGSDEFRIEKIGRAIISLQPDGSQKPYYDSNGSVTALEFFNSVTQINANRIARQEINFDSNFNPTSQISIIYDTDGTTNLRSSTSVYTITSYDLTNVVDNTTGSL